jgi:hypothetical protein
VIDDQVAGDDEEHVDADEAAGHTRDAGVKGNHRQHGDGAQAVDVGDAASALGFW